MLQSSNDKGSNMSYTWTTNGTTYNQENPDVVFSHRGENPNKIMNCQQTCGLKCSNNGICGGKETPGPGVPLGKGWEYSSKNLNKTLR